MAGEITRRFFVGGLVTTAVGSLTACSSTPPMPGTATGVLLTDAPPSAMAAGMSQNNGMPMYQRLAPNFFDGSDHVLFDAQRQEAYYFRNGQNGTWDYLGGRGLNGDLRTPPSQLYIQGDGRAYEINRVPSNSGFGYGGGMFIMRELKVQKVEPAWGKNFWKLNTPICTGCGKQRVYTLGN
jgi:hypothetical protein